MKDIVIELTAKQPLCYQLTHALSHQSSYLAACSRYSANCGMEYGSAPSVSLPN